MPDKRTPKKKKANDALGAGIVSATPENIERYGRATAEYLKGYRGEVDADGEIVVKGLKQISESKVHPDYEYQNLKQQAGFAAEKHYADQQNAQRIVDGEPGRVYRSNDVGRGNDPVYDIVTVDENGELVWGAQMKFSGKYQTEDEIHHSAELLVKKLAGDNWERYRGHDVLVPKEQFDHAREFASAEADRYAKQATIFDHQGNHEKAASLHEKAEIYRQVSEDLKDSGITSKEAMYLREHPELATAKHVADHMNDSGLENAKSCALVAAIIATGQEVISLMRGEKTMAEASLGIVKTTGKSVATVYVIGAADTAIRGVMASQKDGILLNLSKTNTPAMIAMVTVQVGKSLYKYAKGEIGLLELIEELGEKGTGMMSASYAAAIGTAVFPGIGTIVGGVVGYMCSSSLYKACMLTLKEEKLSAERRQRIESIANVAIAAIRSQGEELRTLIREHQLNRQNEIDLSMAELSEAMENKNLQLFTQAMERISVQFGQTLRFRNFQAFDDFMNDESQVFKF